MVKKNLEQHGVGINACSNTRIDVCIPCDEVDDTASIRFRERSGEHGT